MRLAPLRKSDFGRVAHLAVNAGQLPFVGTLKEMFENSTRSRDFHIALKNDIAVGFFVIDRAYSKIYDFAGPGEPGLRGFLIGSEFQGLGYATAILKALPDYLAENYPHAASVVLTVNCKNILAYNCYVKGGFTDTAKLFHGGLAGSQHILRQIFETAKSPL